MFFYPAFFPTEMAAQGTEQNKETHNGILANSKKEKGKGAQWPQPSILVTCKENKLAQQDPRYGIPHTWTSILDALIHLLDVWPLVSHITSQNHKFLFFKMELITLSWRASVKTGENVRGDFIGPQSAVLCHSSTRGSLYTILSL